MKTRNLALAALAAAIFALAAPNVQAGGKVAETAAVNSAVFEVSVRGSGRSDFLWCGAASFARGSLGAGWGDDIYVFRGRGKGQVTTKSTAAQFTLDPAAAGMKPLPKGQGYDTLAVGYSMSVQRANALCSVPPDMFQ